MRVLITKLYNALRLPHGDGAAAALMDMLISSQIPATASDMCNDDHDISLDNGYWQSLTTAEAENIFRTGCANIPEILNSGEKINFSMHIFVPDWACDLLPLPENKKSADPTASPNEVSDPGSVGGKRGRKPILDWQVIWPGIAFIIHQKKGCPASQEQLMDDISQWCMDSFGENSAPGDTTIKDNLRSLYRMISGDSPATVFPNGTRPPRKRKRTAQKHQKIK
jgi:hypothetical protein